MRIDHTVRTSVVLLLGALCLVSGGEPYRYLRITVLECSGEKLQEIDWYAGGTAHPEPHLTGTSSNGMTVWGDNAGWEVFRPYDGDPTTHAWIGDLASPYKHEFYLDLGDGGGIVPDSIMLTKPGHTRLNHFQCWVSTDGVGWELFLDTVLSDPQFTQDAFPLGLVADTEAPTAPTNLIAANITATSASLYWEDATDNRFVDEYRVIRDGAQVGTSTTNSFLDEDLAASTTYEVHVVAADGAGNTSDPSNAVTIVTPAVDQTPPQPPAGVQADAVSDSRLDITWTASSSGSEVVGYVVYLNGNPVGCAEQTQLSVPGLTPSTQYEITVRARDASGNASAPSAAVQAATPAAGAPTMIISTNFWDVAWGGGSADPFREGWEAVGGVNPWKLDLLNELEPYQTLRFMDWGKTNGSPVTHWSERTPMDSLIQRPVAYEWMIDICNRLDKHMWVCIPHRIVSRDTLERGTNNYIKKLAILVKTGVDMHTINLDLPRFAELSEMTRRELIYAGGVSICEPLKPHLQLYIEYSNETWNFGFEQAGYCRDEGVALNLGDGDEYFKGRRFHGWAALKVFEEMEDVFGAGSPRLVRIDGIQQGGNSHIRDHLNIYDNPTHNPRSIYPDAFSPAPYFGNGLNGSSGSIVSELQTAIAEATERSRSNRTYIDSAGAGRGVDFDLIAYEGGQHVTTNADLVNERSEMYDLYMAYFDSMSAFYEEFAHYAHSGSFGSGGAWGAKEYIGQSVSEAHKYRAILHWQGMDTPFPIDFFAPSVPGNLTATAVLSTEVSLAWDAATDNTAIDGYQVFQNGFYIGYTTTNAYTITGLTPESAYYYSVKAKDPNGNLSLMSDTLTATTASLGAAGHVARRPAGPAHALAVPSLRGILIRNAANAARITVFDIAGRTLYDTRPTHEGAIVIGPGVLSRGTYVVRIVHTDARVTERRLSML